MNQQTSEATVEPSSFRDPSGAVFRRDSVLYRQVNQKYQAQYLKLYESGLYEHLVDRKMLVPHVEVDASTGLSEDAFKVIAPDLIPMISYPYEWSFGQLKAAALLALDIHRASVEHGMVLKDASAYNVQFVGCAPIFIDTLSFDDYEEGKPWVAYRQFCQHFLAPLALAAKRDIRLIQLMRTHIDGVPLDLASELLPRMTRLSPGLLAHIHLHARSQRKFSSVHSSEKRSKAIPSISKQGMLGIINSLYKMVENLKWQAEATEWGDYYDDTNYDEPSMAAKIQLVRSMLGDISPVPGTVVDLGANTGRFSAVAAELNVPVVAADIDPLAVERHFNALTGGRPANILPLIVDLTNPPGGIGWASAERDSFADRIAGSTVMALALIHHLAIANNVGFDRLCQFFAGVCKTLIIEFVPKSDSQVQRLLVGREDIFDHYDIESFEAEFAKRFEISDRQHIPGTERTLYRLTTRS